MSANWPNFETLINGRGPFDSRFSATFSGDDPQSMPEPTTLTLLGLGLVAAVSRRRRRAAFHPTSSR
jgi:PEP-CTERM motif